MLKRTGPQLLLLLVLTALGTLFYYALFHWDNKYTAALPGGYGYSVLPEDPQQVFFLVDGWEFYPGQLLEPEDFAAGTAPRAYTYIGEYPNFSAPLGSPYGTATYRLILRYEGAPTELALYLPELLCAGKIYLNGVLAGQHGSLSPYQPLVTDGIYSFTADGDTEILIQCANYSHYYSGMYYPPAVGTVSAVAKVTWARLMVYGLLCFSALTLALHNLIQWLLGRDRLIRWMGLLSLAFALRVSYPFLRALGAPSVRLLYGLEDLCGSCVLLCAILLAGELSGRAARWYHRRAAVPGAAALCTFTTLFPLIILPYLPSLINFYGYVLFFWKLAASLYLLFLSVRPMAGDLLLKRYLLCAAGFYGLSLGVSVLFANRLEPIRGAWPEECGGFAVVVGFAAMMVRRGVLLTRENRRLTLYLQEEVDRKTRGMDLLLKERRELLANLLHDLKNPLAALRNYAELVRQEGVALDQETASYLDALTERAETVEERLDLLQDFSRGERGMFPMEPLCLNLFLRQFYTANLPDMELSGTAFRLRLPRESVWICGSRERLRTALENLCYNALSFTPAQGTITLSLTAEDRTAVISVRDTGSGIAPEDLPHVFERGFTRRSDGSGEGLGLFLVRTFALEHGGTAEAASRPGEGSTFTIRLPRLPKPQ